MFSEQEFLVALGQEKQASGSFRSLQGALVGDQFGSEFLHYRCEPEQVFVSQIALG
jgi:hypothetical protein